MQLSSDLNRNIFSFLTLVWTLSLGGILISCTFSWVEFQQCLSVSKGISRPRVISLTLVEGSLRSLENSSPCYTPGAALVLTIALWLRQSSECKQHPRENVACMGQGSHCPLKRSNETIFYSTLEKYTEIPQSPSRAHLQ